MTVRDELVRAIDEVTENAKWFDHGSPDESTGDRFLRDHGPALVEALDCPGPTGVVISEELAKYLYGSGPLDGTWFGDHNPNKKPYWWRDELGKAIDAARGEK